MKYEFRSSHLQGAVAAAVRSFGQKSEITINAGRSSYQRASLRADLTRGARYTISWEAEKPGTEVSDYAITISSSNGNGTTTEAFASRGSWSFTSRTQGSETFSIGVSREIGTIFGRYPVKVSIA